MTRRTFPAVALSVAGVLFLFVCYMAFVFPKTLAVWEDRGAKLTTTQLLLVKISAVCTESGRLILLVLAATVVVSMVFLVLSTRSPANKS